MPDQSVTTRLEAGDVLLMDGGMGEELERRGGREWAGSDFEGSVERDEVLVDAEAYLEQADPGSMRETHNNFLRSLGPWSACANLDSPDLVRSLHEDYLRAGADIIISNTFWASPSKLAAIGRGREWQDYARTGAELAVEARDRINPQAYVAGGMAPAQDVDTKSDFAARAKVLADAGVDILQAEYLGDSEDAVRAVEGCAGLGLPIFVAVRHASADGSLQYVEEFSVLARALEGMPVAAILIMCSSPRNASAGLKNLRESFDGPVGVYPNNPREGLEREAEIACYADYAREWLSLGAQIVGGCCGTDPEHIARIAPLVTSRS